MIEKEAIGILNKRFNDIFKDNDDYILKYYDKEAANKIAKTMRKYLLFIKAQHKIKKLLGKKSRLLWIMETDCQAVEKCDGIIVLGVKAKSTKGLNCGLCGYETCEKFIINSKDNKGVCQYKIFDFSMELGKLVNLSADLKIDNRIMYTVGESIRRSELKDYDYVLAVLLSVNGKNIFFDRYLRFFVDKARQKSKSVDSLLDEAGIQTN